ncbi:hypothetical protein [Paenibacillus sp. OSY-SE]|uniref:hypothetical protein n=1 Tax=Paenibacillus sp. OSY-SE TaxID=1196323 RepID=UPI00035D7990|nr:hypothetical protein [Paenibacillus sp. OSY-SE]
MKSVKVLVILLSCVMLIGCSKKDVLEGVDFTKVFDEVIGYLYIDDRLYSLKTRDNFPEEDLGKQIGEVHEIVEKPVVDGDVVYPEATRTYEIRKGDKIFRVKDGDKLLVVIQTRDGFILGVIFPT